MNNQVVSFLQKFQMDPFSIDVKKALYNFNEEIKKGLKIDAPVSVCSIPMIVTYLNPTISPKLNEQVLVVDAGGTNLRVGVAKYNGEDFEIIKLKEDKMPGITREYSNDEFFDYIAKMMIPFLDDAKNIGFCFSYRVKMNKDLDGSLIAWAKEIKAKEVVGKNVGAELLKAIKKYSNVERKIAVLNDTTAVLLGGIPLDREKKYHKYIGAIYGTGFNCCYMENVGNIEKINGSKDELMIINTETGNFNGFNRGKFDEELDLSSSIVGEALTEKMSSGRYLATLIYKATMKAISEGLLHKDTKLPSFDEFDLPLVSMYLAGINNSLDQSFVSREDVETFKEICLELIDRASKVVATTISAFAIKSGELEIGIIIEGSTFYKLPTFKEKFNNYLNDILKDYNIKYELFDGRNRILTGAALAAMSKK